jgi:hypothetical protein
VWRGSAQELLANVNYRRALPFISDCCFGQEWNQLGEQKQRLMLEYKERAASLNSGTDIADKAKPGTPESLHPPDQQLPMFVPFPADGDTLAVASGRQRVQPGDQGVSDGMNRNSSGLESQEFEEEMNRGYIDFYHKLDTLAKINKSGASFSRQKLGRLFESHCLFLYMKILAGYKIALVESDLRTSVAVERLLEFSDSLFETIYYERLLEFIQRAGFWGAQSFLDKFIDLIPENAKGKTSKRIRQLEDELRGFSAAPFNEAEVYNDAEPIEMPPYVTEALAKPREGFSEPIPQPAVEHQTGGVATGPTGVPTSVASPDANSADPDGAERIAAEARTVGRPLEPTSEQVESAHRSEPHGEPNAGRKPESDETPTAGEDKTSTVSVHDAPTIEPMPQLEKESAGTPSGIDPIEVHTNTEVQTTGREVTSQDVSRIMKAAMERCGLNPPGLAKRVHEALKADAKRRRSAEKPRTVDRSTIYRIVSGKIKTPNPAIRNALIGVLELLPDEIAAIKMFFSLE